MPGLDQHLLSPARLRLMTTLTAGTALEFAVLREMLEITDSVLSKHVALLAGQGYVRSRKGVRDGRRTTWISITPRGRAVLGAHVAALREIIDAVE